MAEIWGWGYFFEQLETFLTTANREIESNSFTYAQYVQEKLQICLQVLSIILSYMEVDPSDPATLDPAILELRSDFLEVRDCCVVLRGVWDSRVDEIDLESSMLSSRFQPPLVRTGSRGRPQLLISEDQLTYLRSLHFSWSRVAELLGVSRMTIYRRRRDLHIVDADIGQHITDAELQSLLEQLRQSMPNVGETLIIGRLKSLGYSINRQRVRNAIRVTDPLNTTLRWRGILSPCRPYSVASPNSLWHIDGHHKLIRWGMVTHGAIDGYSRLVVYLHCSCNNKAQTVYDLFLTGVQQYGLPSRVRSDYGKENYLVAAHMLEKRGIDRNSMITGSSVHNQRIERLWRDMHRCVTVVFYKLFYYLEQEGHLDPDSAVHRFALQYVYVPHINKALQMFLEGWNAHGIRTCRT